MQPELHKNVQLVSVLSQLSNTCSRRTASPLKFILNIVERIRNTQNNRGTARKWRHNEIRHPDTETKQM